MHQRIDKVRNRINHFKLDALLITSLVNIRYLFGFTGSNAIALIASDLSFFITDRRYKQQASEQVHNAKVIIAEKDLFAELQNTTVFNSSVKLAFEAANLSVKNYTRLRKLLPKSKLIASEKIIENIACIKDSGELECCRKAAAIVCQVYEDILGLIKPGMSELELAADISFLSKQFGSEKDPFEPIVASGGRSAMPHAQSSDKIMQKGDLLLMDFGAVKDGYNADFTRTIVLGQPTEKQIELAAAVLEALQLTDRAAKPGITGKELDSVARQHFTKLGFENNFLHALGHGLGLEVHGLPRIGELSSDMLEPGQVITLEPGLYFPEIGGVRIEDDFIVTENGVINLTPVTREMVCVD